LQGVVTGDIARPVIRDYDEEAHSHDLRAQVTHVNIPMYNVGGWYDIFEQGTLDSFTALQTEGGPKARGNQKLMMGAFGHGALKGDLKYPAEAGNLNEGDTIRWFDYWLKGIDNGVMKEPAVRYYVMGDTFDKSAPGNTWRTAESWPPPSTATSYYLTESHTLSSVKPSGTGKLSTWPRYRKTNHRCAGGFSFSTNRDLVQRYRELPEVVIVERALGIGRLLERESLRHFDVEGAGLDQAINLFERRILIFPVIHLHGDAGTIFLRQLNTVRIGDSSTATQRC
jgi:predicted acyl esterase